MSLALVQERVEDREGRAPAPSPHPAGTPAATFYVVKGDGNATEWRVDWPAQALRAKVCAIPESKVNLLLEPHKRGWLRRKPFPWMPEGDSILYPAHEGAAVWTRPDSLRAKHALGMQDQGILTVAEVDDNYLSAAQFNMFMRANNYGAKERDAHLRAMACFDRVACSTKWLAERYHKAFRTKLPQQWRFSLPEVFVAGNHVPLSRWPKVPEHDGRLRIGWMGSAQHARDIKLAYPALAWAHEQGHEVVLIGHDVRDETGVTNPKGLEWCRAWREIIDTHIPWVAPHKFRRSALPLDIGLAPLEINDHTRGKSDCKALDYLISGAVPVLSDHPVYREHWRHGETALLAKDPHAMLHCVVALCRTPRVRERILKAGQQYAREERSDKALREEWGNVVKN